MAAVMAYALRRSSARIVLLLGAGGLLLALFRVLGLVPLAPSFGTVPITLWERALSLPEASPWDVALATLVAAVGLVSGRGPLARPGDQSLTPW